MYFVSLLLSSIFHTSLQFLNHGASRSWWYIPHRSYLQVSSPRRDWNYNRNWDWRWDWRWKCLFFICRYIPWNEESGEITSCGIPTNYKTSTEGWADKKVVLFAVPGKLILCHVDCHGTNQDAALGAFTPTCSAEHVPGFIKKLPELREKGVDIVAVLAYNDPYVMSAWGKANEVRNNDIVSTLPRSNSRSSRSSRSILTFMISFSSPTPRPSSRRALAGLTRHLDALGDTQ